MHRVTLYTRRGCHLCDEAKNAIEAARSRATFEFEETDIDADPALQKLYNDEIPVIAINGRKAFKYRLTTDDLLRKLAAR